ncbi:MAG: SRPBCC family protein [Actinomycetota bacterium]
MSTPQIVIRAPAEAVFDVLMDPRCYPRWVVGAHRIRDVDPDWPRDGSSFHHSVGVRPFLIDDSTTLVHAERPRLVELRARAWPLGEADVRLELEQRDGLTRVTMREVPVEGPGRAIWRAPVAAITTLRNRWSLKRLKRLVEERSGRASA